MPQLVQDYQRLINQAVVELPGATDAGIRQALFEVFHTFFTETNSWQETITVAVLAGVTEYNLVIAEGGEFVRLLSLVDTNDIGQPAVTDMVGVLTLRDTPNTAATFTATIAKTIGVPVDREGKPEIPEWVVARWEPVLSAGLLSRMMIQNKKPYSDKIGATFWGRRFLNGLGSVKSAVLHGNLQGANTWSYPRGFAMSRTSQRMGSGGTDTSFGV
jgi:hypothetical protein